MVRSILGASNLKKGTVEYNMTKFDIRALISDLSYQLSPMAEEKGLKFELDVDSKKTFFVNGDLIHLAQVVRNLIENSIHYTPKGSIKVSLKREEDTIVFGVKDTGIGLDEDDRRVLFSEGGRGKQAQKENVNSTGFGLFIVKEVVEAHKGAVEAKSEGRDKGSEFIVKIPAAE
jgi:signal transduction histidine kinase